MRSNRRKNWFIKRVALGFAVAAVAAPAAQAKVDEGSSVAQSPAVSAQGFGRGDQIEFVRSQPRGASSDQIEFVRSQPRSTGAGTVAASSFNWGDASVGAGIALALVLLGGGAAVATGRLGRAQTA
jgi:hypothetical protein